MDEKHEWQLPRYPGHVCTVTPDGKWQTDSPSTGSTAWISKEVAAEILRLAGRVKELETEAAAGERSLTLAEALAEQRRLEVQALEGELATLFKRRNRSLLEEQEAVLEAAAKPWRDEVHRLRCDLVLADQQAAEAKGQAAIYCDRLQVAQKEADEFRGSLERLQKKLCASLATGNSANSEADRRSDGWPEAAEYARLLGLANARIDELLEENSRRPGHRKEVEALGELLSYLVKRFAEDGHGGYYVPMQGWCGNMVQLLYARLCAALPANGQAIAGERVEPGALADYPEGHPLHTPGTAAFSPDAMQQAAHEVREGIRAALGSPSWLPNSGAASKRTEGEG